MVGVCVVGVVWCVVWWVVGLDRVVAWRGVVAVCEVGGVGVGVGR